MQKYLFPYLLRKDKSEPLGACASVLTECGIRIWQNFHGAVCYIDKIHHHLNALMFAQHISA